MGTQKMTRFVQLQNVTVSSGTSVSGVVYKDTTGGGTFITPTALEATTKIAFKVSDTDAGPFVPLYDATGALLEVTVDLASSRAYPLPDQLFGVPVFQIFTEASGTGVSQSADRAFKVLLQA
jgi:hypothetical protein